MLIDIAVVLVLLGVFTSEHFIGAVTVCMDL